MFVRVAMQCVVVGMPPPKKLSPNFSVEMLSETAETEEILLSLVDAGTETVAGTRKGMTVPCL